MIVVLFCLLEYKHILIVDFVLTAEDLEVVLGSRQLLALKTVSVDKIFSAILLDLPSALLYEINIEILLSTLKEVLHVLFGGFSDAFYAEGIRVVVVSNLLLKEVVGTVQVLFFTPVLAFDFHYHLLVANVLLELCS